MTKNLFLGNNETETILVNNECIIRVTNVDGQIVLGGIGWLENFEYEKKKYGKPLSILEALNKGYKIEEMNQEESKMVKGIFDNLYENSEPI